MEKHIKGYDGQGQEAFNKTQVNEFIIACVSQWLANIGEHVYINTFFFSIYNELSCNYVS